MIEATVMTIYEDVIQGCVALATSVTRLIC